MNNADDATPFNLEQQTKERRKTEPSDEDDDVE